MSEYLKLNGLDFLKGFVVAIISAVLVIIQNSIAAGDFSFQWSTIWQGALTAGVAYLIKNFFTNAEGTLGKG